MENMTFEKAMEIIIAALGDRGYDPYAQLYGYVLENDPLYITSYNGARSLIQTFDPNCVKQFVLDMKEKN